MKINKRKTIYLIFLTGKEVEQMFLKRDRKVPPKNMKIYLSTLIIIESYIKTTMRYHFITMQLGNIKTNAKTKS